MLLDKRNRLKIGDFGVSKLLNSRANDSTATNGSSKISQKVGTPMYLSPEIVRH